MFLGSCTLDLENVLDVSRKTNLEIFLATTRIVSSYYQNCFQLLLELFLAIARNFGRLFFYLYLELLLAITRTARKEATIYIWLFLHIFYSVLPFTKLTLCSPQLYFTFLHSSTFFYCTQNQLQSMYKLLYNVQQCTLQLTRNKYQHY